MGSNYNHSNRKMADPKAPRFHREEVDIANRENKKFYRDLKKQHPELSKYRNSDIGKCIKLCNIAISNEVVFNRNGVRLLDGLGIVVAGACKVSDKLAENNINVEVRTQTGVEVPHNNLHSDGYVAKVKYSNDVDKHMFQNHEFWSFDPCRKLARAVSEEFKKGNHLNYIVFSTYSHISHIFRREKIKKDDGRAEERKTDRLNQYDEFAFN